MMAADLQKDLPPPPPMVKDLADYAYERVRAFALAPALP